jgi:hypothetical protein
MAGLAVALWAAVFWLLTHHTAVLARGAAARTSQHTHASLWLCVHTCLCACMGAVCMCVYD